MSAPTPYSELADVLQYLGLFVREARRTRGHSQREVGRLSGVSFPTVNRVERGRPFDSGTAIALLHYLDPEHPPTPAVPAPPQSEQLPLEPPKENTDDTP